MNKSYLFAMDATALIFSLVYLLILSGALIQISRYLKIQMQAKLLILLFIYYYLFFLLSTFLPFVPNLPDTDLFANMITENYFPPYQSLGVRLFYGITYPIRVLSGFNLESFIVFQIFIFLVAMLILWKSWQIVLTKNGYNKTMGQEIYLSLIAIYPAFLLYIPIPLREFFILLGFSIMVYGIIDKYYNHKGIPYIILGSIFLLFGRPQLIVIVIIFLALFQKNKWLRNISIIGAIFVIPILFTSLLSFKFNPDFFMYLRNHGAQKHGILGYGIVEWYTYWDIVVDMPGLIAQFLLSPFPFLHDNNPFRFIAIFVDAIFALLVYFSTIYAGFKVSKIYLFVFSISAIMFSIWEYHIAGAARHRMPLIAILLPVASFGILKLYQDIRHK